MKFLFFLLFRLTESDSVDSLESSKFLGVFGILVWFWCTHCEFLTNFALNYGTRKETDYRGRHR